MDFTTWDEAELKRLHVLDTEALMALGYSEDEIRALDVEVERRYMVAQAAEKAAIHAKVLAARAHRAAELAARK